MQFSTSERRKHVNERLREKVQALEEQVAALTKRIQAFEEFEAYTPMSAWIAMIVKREIAKSGEKDVSFQ